MSDEKVTPNTDENNPVINEGVDELAGEIEEATAELLEPEIEIPESARIAELEAALLAAEAKAQESVEMALREKAEAENMRRRAEKDVVNARKFALEKFIVDLLPVVDSIELGLAAASADGADVDKFREGSELTLKMLVSLLENNKVAAIDPQGEKFDPNAHQAISMQEMADVEANTVINVVQKGYALNDRVVRPAMVVVSKAGSAPPTDTKIDEMA